jgi:hypothetical protein
MSTGQARAKARFPTPSGPFRSFGQDGSLPKGKFIPFAPQLAASVMDGRTTGTFRLVDRNFYPRKGEHFKAHCNGYELEATFLCLERRNITFKVMSERYWKTVVDTSKEDYLNIMAEVLGGHYPRPNARGVFIRFQRTDK